jgi:hypothetical protein
MYSIFRSGFSHFFSCNCTFLNLHTSLLPNLYFSSDNWFPFPDTVDLCRPCIVVTSHPPNQVSFDFSYSFSPFSLCVVFHLPRCSHYFPCKFPAIQSPSLFFLCHWNENQFNVLCCSLHCFPLSFYFTPSFSLILPLFNS